MSQHSRSGSTSTSTRKVSQDVSHPPLQGSAPSSGKYDIANVLHDPKAPPSLLPALPSLAQNTYLPSQLTSLGTTFTSAGTLPRSAAPPGKSVVQRRSQAPPIQVTELTRKVQREEFEPYLNEIKDEYERWIKESQITLEGASTQDDGDEDEEGNHTGTPRQRQKRRGERKKRKEEEELPSLEQVPSIFFDPTFNLSNPRTFDLVTERIQVTPLSSPALGAPSSPQLRSQFDDSSSSSDLMPGLGPSTLTELASDQLLQDKLSHLTAVIESHLVREIGLRSSSFFAALSNLQHLHQQGQDALSRIERLKEVLSNPNEGVAGTAHHGLKILRLQARRRGLEQIEEAVRAVEEVSSAVEGVKELVENGEWSAALQVAEEIEEAYFISAISTTSTTKSPSSPSPLTHSSSSSSRTTTTSRSSSLNLTKLDSLRSVPSKLSRLRAQIAKSLEGELISVLEHEMDVGVERGVERGRKRAKKEVGEEKDVEGEDERQELRERAKDRVAPVVNALVKSDGMDSAVQAWRESVLREVRALVREHLPTGATGDKDDEDPFASAAIRSVSKQSIDLGTISEKSLSLAKKLRAMSHEAFLNLAHETYLGLIACIEVVDLQATILLELASASRQEERTRKAKRRRQIDPLQESSLAANGSTSLSVPGTNIALPTLVTPSSASPPNGSAAGDDLSTLSTEITDVLTAVTELANVRFSKVIGVRSEVHAQLSLEEFLTIFDSTWEFVLRCEVLAKRMIVGLRGAMVSQAKGWLSSFHQKRITESARSVEEEQWSAAEVPKRIQEKVTLIVKGAMEDPPELLLGSRSKNETREVSNGDTNEGPAKQIDVEGKQYFAVIAGLTAIESLSEYLQVVLNCPMLTTDAMSKIIEFMKIFNSRSCQVVLGAGAMRSAGLKNITAKNLALASQALSIMVSLIPYIRELIRRHLNPKQAVMLTEFDKLKRDYQEHQYEIHSKLVAIMSDRLIVHSRTLESINWEEPSSRPGQPNAYMEALIKEHLTLHKVLSRFLHAETVFSIMSQVFTALDTKLTDEFAKVELKSEDAQTRILGDVKYLQEKLGSLKGLEETNPGKAIEEAVLAKPLPPKPTKSAPTATSLARQASIATETPLPSTPSLATSVPASASASALSLALPDAPSTPRTSLDAPSSVSSPPRPRARSPSPGPTPPSPVPIPAPLPPSPQLSGPAPYKRKTLAERLAERIGRKPTEPIPPQQSLLLSPTREHPPRRSWDNGDVTSDRREETTSTTSESEMVGLGVKVGEEGEKGQLSVNDDKLIAQIEKEIPVWTPKGEKELEAVEKEIEKEVLAAENKSEEGESEVAKEEEPSEEKSAEEAHETSSNDQQDVSPAQNAQTGESVEEAKEDTTELETVEPPSQEEPSTLETTPATIDTELLPETEDKRLEKVEESTSTIETSESVPSPTDEGSSGHDTTPVPPEVSEAPESTREDEAEGGEARSVDEPAPEASADERVGTLNNAVEDSTTADVPSTSIGMATDVVDAVSIPVIESTIDDPSNEVPVKADHPTPDSTSSSEQTPTESHTAETLVPPTTSAATASIPSVSTEPASASISSPPPPVEPSSASSPPVTALPTIQPPPPAQPHPPTEPVVASTPPRKKTLKERLAEAARRGSTGSSLVNTQSSATPTTARSSIDVVVPATVKEEPKKKEESTISKVENGSTSTTTPPSAEGKMREEKQDAEVVVPIEEKEEEGSFL